MRHHVLPRCRPDLGNLHSGCISGEFCVNEDI
jgi:hypothetical protein